MRAEEHTGAADRLHHHAFAMSEGDRTEIVRVFEAVSGLPRLVAATFALMLSALAALASWEVAAMPADLSPAVSAVSILCAVALIVIRRWLRTFRRRHCVRPATFNKRTSIIARRNELWDGAQSVPWSDVTRLVETGDFLLFIRGRSAPVVVHRKSLADAAEWQEAIEVARERCFENAIPVKMLKPRRTVSPWLAFRRDMHR